MLLLASSAQAVPGKAGRAYPPTALNQDACFTSSCTLSGGSIVGGTSMVLVHTVLRSAHQMGGGTSVLGTFLIRATTLDITEGGLKERICVPVQVNVPRG